MLAVAFAASFLLSACGGGGGGGSDTGLSPRLLTDAPAPASCNYSPWVQGTIYEAGSIVNYQGSLYVAKMWNAGSSPTPNQFGWSDWTPYDCSSPAPTPAPTPAPAPTPSPVTCTIQGKIPDWVQGQVYEAGTIVLYAGSLYQAKMWNAGSVPTPNAFGWSDWKLVDCTLVTPPPPPPPSPTPGTCVAEPWVQGKVYDAGRVVTYQGRLYIANMWNAGSLPTPNANGWSDWSPYDCVAPEIQIEDGTVVAGSGEGYLVGSEQSAGVWLVQRHGADGSALGGAVTLTAGAVGRSTGGVPAPLAGGGYAVVWLRLVDPGCTHLCDTTYQVMTQAFDANGRPLGSPVGGADTVFSAGFLFNPTYRFPMPVIAPLVGGGYVIASSGAAGVSVQRFNADGSAATAPQIVASHGAGDLGAVGTATGGYMVTWAMPGAVDGGIRAYTAGDVPVAPAQAAGPGLTESPNAIAPLRGGGAVLGWVITFAGSAYLREEPVGPDGSPIAAYKVVDGDSPAMPARNSHNPGGVAGLPDGGYVVAWTEAGEVHARRFAADGSPLGNETRINLGTTSASNANVVDAAGGGFIVTWSAIGADGARHNYQRAFSANALLGTP